MGLFSANASAGVYLGGVLPDVGAGFLVAWPEATQGMRQIDPDAPDGTATWPGMAERLGLMNRRLTGLGLDPIDDMGRDG